jgi:transcriptional regulator with XRE-family HTH domain
MATVMKDGEKVKRIREILKVKQETLAAELGISQPRLSTIEQKEEIDDELMDQIAAALKVSAEDIRNFDEDKAINIISHNTFENCQQPASIFYNSTINPIDKWMEALKKNEDLYERLLQSEKDKVTLLENVLKLKQ